MGGWVSQNLDSLSDVPKNYSFTCFVGRPSFWQLCLDLQELPRRLVGLVEQEQLIGRRDVIDAPAVSFLVSCAGERPDFAIEPAAVWAEKPAQLSEEKLDLTAEE